MNGQPGSQVLYGVVETLTATGLRLEGQRLYLDFTTQHDVTRPRPGQAVKLAISPKKTKDGAVRPNAYWVNRVEVDDSSAANAAPAAPAQVPGSVSREGGWTQADVERVTRLSLISSAATFLAGREATKRHVLLLADYWLPYSLTGELPPRKEAPGGVE